MKIEKFKNGSKVIFESSTQGNIHVKTKCDVWISKRIIRDEIKRDGIFLPSGTDINLELIDDGYPPVFWVEPAEANIYMENYTLVINND